MNNNILQIFVFKCLDLPFWRSPCELMWINTASIWASWFVNIDLFVDLKYTYTYNAMCGLGVSCSPNNMNSLSIHTCRGSGSRFNNKLTLSDFSGLLGKPIYAGLSLSSKIVVMCGDREEPMRKTRGLFWLGLFSRSTI